MCWTTSCRRRWSTRSRWRRSCRGRHELQGFVVCWTYSSNEVLISGHTTFPVIYVLQSGPKAFPVFLDSLRESYSWLVEFMMENHAVDGGQKTVVRFKIKDFHSLTPRCCRKLFSFLSFWCKVASPIRHQRPFLGETIFHLI